MSLVGKRTGIKQPKRRSPCQYGCCGGRVNHFVHLSASPATVRAMAASDILSGKRILAVDDEFDVFDIVKDELESCSVVTATD